MNLCSQEGDISRSDKPEFYSWISHKILVSVVLWGSSFHLLNEDNVLYYGQLCRSCIIWVDHLAHSGYSMIAICSILQIKYGSTCFQSQHSGGWDRKIMSLRSAWAMYLNLKTTTRSQKVFFFTPTKKAVLSSVASTLNAQPHWPVSINERTNITVNRYLW